MNSTIPNHLPNARRGLVLVMVLVVMLFAIWTASLLISSAQVQAGSASIAERQARSQAVLLSGIDVLVRTLANQRATILGGQQVEIDNEYVIYTTDTHEGVVRLLPITPDGAHVRNEATCLDLNHATSEQLLATGLVEPEVAQAIIKRREVAGPFGSISELLMVDGMSPSCLYGDVAELDYTSQARGDKKGLGERVLDRLGIPEPRGLADVVTVYSCDLVSSSLDEPNINLSSGWSKQIEGQLKASFDNQTVVAIEAVFVKRPPKDDGQLAQKLASRLTPDELARVLAAVTVSTEPHRLGRVDINHASPLILEALGGLDPEQVQQIYQQRGDLDELSAQSPLWPYLQGLIREDQLAVFCNQVTTRGLAYRFVLAAGEVDIDDPESQLIQPRIFEVVVDLVDPSPRVAYLRDISLLQTAARLTQQDPGLEAAQARATDLFEQEHDSEEGLYPDTEDASNTWVTSFEPRTDYVSPGYRSVDQAELDEVDAEREPLPAVAENGRIGRWRVVR